MKVSVIVVHFTPAPTGVETSYHRDKRQLYQLERSRQDESTMVFRVYYTANTIRMGRMLRTGNLIVSFLPRPTSIKMGIVTNTGESTS